MLSDRKLNFWRRSEGATTVLFSLSLIPIIAVTGVSVDLGSVYLARTQLQEAIDAAALASARNLQTTKDVNVASALATSMFAAAAPKSYSSRITDLIVDGVKGEVSMTATTTVPMSMMRVLSSSNSQIDISASAQAVSQQGGLGKNLEVSLMLDVTSSMTSGSGTSGMTKLQAMQAAAKNVINTVVKDSQTPHKSRVALVPFSAAVNVGSYFQAVTNAAPNGSWKSVVERTGASAFTDDAPKAGTFFPSYEASHSGALSPSSTISRLERNRTTNIPTTSILVPLSSNKAALSQAIDQFSANGTTAGHIGTAWAWYTLSPKWSSIFSGASAPAPYDKDTVKVAILMSDFDYNVYYKSANGDMNTQAAALCANMKAAGVVVYTIGFQVESTKPHAVDLFNTCATDPSKALPAQTGADMIVAFQTIANTVLDSVSSPIRLAR